MSCVAIDLSRAESYKTEDFKFGVAARGVRQASTGIAATVSLKSYVLSRSRVVALWGLNRVWSADIGL
jgi:hypothetical protein